MTNDARPAPPARRTAVTVTVNADDVFAAGALLLTIATDLMSDALDRVDRYYVANDDGMATGHVLAVLRPEITAESYRAALEAWARETIRTHPRPEIRATAGDGETF